MSEPTPRRSVAQGRTVASGNALRPLCHDCPQQRSCVPAQLDDADVARFEKRIFRAKGKKSGDHLFRIGDPFESLFAVQSGCFKTYATDTEGREHVLNFHFSGELIGADAIYLGRHISSCVALGDCSVCVLPYRTVSELALGMPGLQHQLFRILSRDAAAMSSIAGDFRADERLAAFLVMVSARMASEGQPPTELQLAMSRQDIANYLRLATETISRILARFQRNGLVKADRKNITLTDLTGLMQKAECMNPWSRWGQQLNPNKPLPNTRAT